MDLFKERPVLKLGLPQPAVQVRWSKIMTVDPRHFKSYDYDDYDDDGGGGDEGNDYGRRYLTGRLWLTRIEDYTDYTTLSRTLQSLDDWSVFVRSGNPSPTFQWYFDGRRYGSDNPYFELLMRILRHLCLSYNRSLPLCPKNVACAVETCLDNLAETEGGVGRSGVHLGPPPMFVGHDRRQIGWLNADFFSALLTLETSQRLMVGLADRSSRLVFEGSQTTESILNFELAEVEFFEFVEDVVEDATNPLRDWWAYGKYFNSVSAKFVRPLRLLTEVKERHTAFTTDSDVFLPSVWKRLRATGTTLPSCITESTVLHETDRKCKEKVISLFLGEHLEPVEDDLAVDENKIRRERLKRCMNDEIDERPPKFLDSPFVSGNLLLGVKDLDVTVICGCAIL